MHLYFSKMGNLMMPCSNWNVWLSPSESGANYMKRCFFLHCQTTLIKLMLQIPSTPRQPISNMKQHVFLCVATDSCHIKAGALQNGKDNTRPFEHLLKKLLKPWNSLKTCSDIQWYKILYGIVNSITGWCSTPTLLLICSSFSRENCHQFLICSSLSTAQIIYFFLANFARSARSISKFKCPTAHLRSLLGGQDFGIIHFDHPMIS